MTFKKGTARILDRGFPKAEASGMGCMILLCQDGLVGCRMLSSVTHSWANPKHLPTLPVSCLRLERRDTGLFLPWLRAIALDLFGTFLKTYRFLQGLRGYPVMRTATWNQGSKQTGHSSAAQRAKGRRPPEPRCLPHGWGQTFIHKNMGTGI